MHQCHDYDGKVECREYKAGDLVRIHHAGTGESLEIGVALGGACAH